jgi:hypothetical protein
VDKWGWAMRNTCVALSSIIVLGFLTQAATAKNPKIEQALASRVGTLSNDAEPVFTNGVLTGCTLNFATLVQDFTYKAGAFARVDGSFNLLTSKNNNLGLLLKIVVNDFDPQTYERTPSKPATAFFVSGNATSLPFLIKQSIGSDTPGAIVAVYNTEKTLPMLVQGVTAGTITVAFARTAGGTDMQVPVDLTVEGTDDGGHKTRSNNATKGFLECGTELIKVMEDRLKPK